MYRTSLASLPENDLGGGPSTGTFKSLFSSSSSAAAAFCPFAFVPFLSSSGAAFVFSFLSPFEEEDDDDDDDDDDMV